MMAQRGRPPGGGRPGALPGLPAHAATVGPPTMATTDLSYTEERGSWEEPLAPDVIVRRQELDAQAEALKVNWQDTQRREAERWEVPYGLWITLTDTQKTQYMRQQPPDWTQPSARTAKMGTIAADSSTDQGELEREFRRRASGVVMEQDEADWVVVCDAVKQHREWGTYTPGLSRIPRRALEKKLRPRGDGKPTFTISPVAPFMPPEEVFCEIPGLDGAPCAYGAWYDTGKKDFSTMMERHKKRRHPEEWESAERIIMRTQAERGTSRDDVLIESLQQQNTALRLLMERLEVSDPANREPSAGK